MHRIYMHLLKCLESELAGESQMYRQLTLVVERHSSHADFRGYTSLVSVSYFCFRVDLSYSPLLP